MNLENKLKHHPKLLSSMLDNFSYTLELLSAIVMKSMTSKEILENNSSTNSIGEWNSINSQAFDIAPHF
jgi:hypothetical protein